MYIYCGTILFLDLITNNVFMHFELSLLHYNYVGMCKFPNNPSLDSFLSALYSLVQQCK